MRRRVFLATVGAVTLTGCAETADSSTGEPGSTATSPASTDESTTERGVTPEDPYEMDADTAIIEVTVDAGYEGQVTLAAACRGGDDRVVDPGLGEEIERRESGEECQVVVRVGGTAAFDRNVAGHESFEIRITADGSLETSLEVL